MFLNFADGTRISINGSISNVQTGTFGNDTLSAGSGASLLIGGYGDDTLIGSNGDDIFIDTSGHNVISGGQGNDAYYLSVMNGHNVIEDTSGQDTIHIVDPGIDFMDLYFELTEEGDLRISTQNSDDTLFQVSGQIIIEGYTSGQIEALVINGQTYTIAGMTVAETGTSGDDTLAAVSGTSWLNGGGGNDTLTGGTGVDYLLGGAGDDALTGAAGNDVLFGGHDDDTLDGGAGDDRLLGEQGNDIVTGGAGKDVVFGGAGDDTLSGDGDRDVLNGGDGNDVLDGGADNDIIFGGGGDDTIMGSAGKDTIHFDGGNDVLSYTGTVARANQDTVVFDGIAAEQLWFSQSQDGDDLVITVLGSEDSFTIENWFNGTIGAREFIADGNRQVMSSSDVQALVDAMAGFNPDQVAEGEELPEALHSAIDGAWDAINVNSSSVSNNISSRRRARGARVVINSRFKQRGRVRTFDGGAVGIASRYTNNHSTNSLGSNSTGGIFRNDFYGS